MSDKLRVAVTGASGFIGKKLLGVFRDHQVTGVCFSHPRPGLVPVDLRNSESVRAFMDETRPDVVIHCAARPSVDWCELHPEEARKTNLQASYNLAGECGRRGSRVVFMSTDYVFDGVNGPYTETDAPNPINVYGRLKLEAENAIRRLADKHIIVRTTNVYGFDPESKNFLMALLPRLARGEHVSVASDQFGNPILATDLCSVTKELVLKQRTGTFHVAGPDLVNRVEWLRRAAQVFGADPSLVSGVLTSELDQPAPRPRKSGLISKVLDSIVAKRAMNLDDGLNLLKREWDQHHMVPRVCEVA